MKKPLTKPYRSKITTHGRQMAGARALWRANGFTDADFEKPIIAIANSYTQFVPGHIHLKEVGEYVKKVIDQAGGIGVEFNTIAIDDGIAMGHNGMLYSLPSRELIADSVEYMVQAHVADALICITNCDKITPGMMMAALRINIPTIFVSGGPMEAGTLKKGSSIQKLDLVDAMVAGADDAVTDQELSDIEHAACPTCGSCSGMFTANSMNCLTEVLGLALPGNGTLLATHKERKKLFEKTAIRIVEMAKAYYIHHDESVLPKNIITQKACENAMRLDITMGGSTNTVLHLLAIAHEADVSFSMNEIDQLSRATPTLCKVAPSSSYHLEDVHHAGGISAILGELAKEKLLHLECKTVSGLTLKEIIAENDPLSPKISKKTLKTILAAPSNKKTRKAFSQNKYYKKPDLDREKGCIRSIKHAYSKDGGLCVLYGNIARNGCIVKTAGVPEECLIFHGKAKVFESQEDAVEALLANRIQAGDCIVIRYEGPKGGPGMQEMLYPTSYIKSKKLGKLCALITDGRFSGGTAGLSIGHISPEAAQGGEIALIHDNDPIIINIPKRYIQLEIPEEELARRKTEMESLGHQAYKPLHRTRKISKALQNYAIFAESADKGGVRELKNGCNH